MFCQHAQKIKKRHFHTSDTDIPEKQNDQQSHDHKKRNQIAERSVCFCPGIILFFFYYLLRRLLIIACMATKSTCRSELSKFMAHHVFCYVNRNEFITVMDSNGVPHKIRGYH